MNETLFYGDYGLSDCILPTEKDWDYVDAWFDIIEKDDDKCICPIIIPNDEMTLLDTDDDDRPF